MSSIKINLTLTLHAAWEPHRRPSRCSAMTCVALLVMFHWHILEERNYLPQRSHWFTELDTSSGLSGGPALSRTQLSFLCRSPHFPKRHCLTCSILLPLRSTLPIAEPEKQRSLRGPLNVAVAAHVTARSLLVHVALALRLFALTPLALLHQCLICAVSFSM